MKFRQFFLLSLVLLGLSACREPGSEASRTEVAAMDTIMTLTVYGQDEQTGTAVLREAGSLIRELDSRLSVTDENSEIFRVNHSRNMPVEVSEDAAELLDKALELCEMTGGKLDISIYPVVSAWGFTTGNFRVPDDDEIAELLDRTGYERIVLDDGAVALDDGMELDLGAVAKGFAGDRLMKFFQEKGVESAIVSLGGNVQTLGAKPDGSPWKVAVQAPEGGYAGALDVVGKAVVTSGGYQRFFVRDGKTYIHIIDPETGKPVDNGLASVTVVADCGVVGDGLSTALFVMGFEDAVEFWREYRDFDAVFLMEDGSAAITEGLEDCFSLYGEWTGRPLEIIR